LIKEIDLSMDTIVVSEGDYLNGILSKELGAYFEIKLIGRHNLFNAYCAIQAVRHVGLDDSIINLGLKTFNNAPHRMETIAVINDIKYINDSKATNVDAVYYALEGIKENIIWIVGGTDKGNDYTPLMDLVAKKVNAIVCLGLDNEKLKKTFYSIVPVIEESRSMEDAIRRATTHAGQGEVVLLSPACASFDLFRNYMDRGEQFRAEVWKLV
jgi:UDP-N-acetylmuramoylalanine--D-glutamate ligase